LNGCRVLLGKNGPVAQVRVRGGSLVQRPSTKLWPAWSGSRLNTSSWTANSWCWRERAHRFRRCRRPTQVAFIASVDELELEGIVAKYEGWRVEAQHVQRLR